MTASPQAPSCGEASHERSRSSATGTGIAYSQAFAEVLAERPLLPRVKPTLRLTEDSRHSSTLLSGALVCVLATATIIALWQSLTVGMVTPDGAIRGVSMQRFVPSSFSNSPAPVRSVIDALQSDANVLIEELRTLNIATAGVITYTGQAWAQSAGQIADTGTKLQSSAEAFPVVQVALDQEPALPQPAETGVQTSPVPRSSLPYKTEKDSGSQYWSMTGQRLASVNTASAPASASTSQGSVDASTGDSSGSSVDETAKAKGTRKEAHTSRSDSKGSAKSKSGKDRNSASSSGGKTAKADSHYHAGAGHANNGGEKGKAGKDHKDGDKGKKKD